jgi:hypothetical protein
LENNLWFEKGRLIEDIFYSMQAVSWANRVVVVPHAVYFYKNRENSILTSTNKEIRKKRRNDYKYFKRFCVDFAQKNGVHTLKDEQVGWIQYKLFGIPIMKKRVSDNGRMSVYLFGCQVLRKKNL